MTNREAIKRLENCSCSEYMREAINCAIKALKERPQGDLISRKALKEAIRKRLGISSLKYLTEQERVVVEEIDNVQTVPNEYMRGYEAAEREYKRPQGEWINLGEEIGAMFLTYTRYECSLCGYETSLVIPRNFCPNCGADMRGGRE